MVGLMDKYISNDVEYISGMREVLINKSKNTSFDTISYIVTRMGDVKHTPDAMQLVLMEMIVNSKIDGIKRTPIDMVRMYTIHIVHIIYHQRELKIKAMKRLEEILNSLSSTEHLTMDSNTDYKIAELVFEILNRPGAEFAEDFETSWTLVGIINRLLVSLAEHNGESNIQKDVIRKHPFVVSRRLLKLNCLWLVVHTNIFYQSNFNFMKASKTMISMLEPLPKLEAFEEYILTQDMERLKEDICRVDKRRWLFVITKVQDYVWEMLETKMKEKGLDIEEDLVPETGLISGFLRREIRESYDLILENNKV